jgi:hypothetical protein
MAVRYTIHKALHTNIRLFLELACVGNHTSLLHRATDDGLKKFHFRIGPTNIRLNDYFDALKLNIWGY